jgi:outer membrane protein assembly factor BamB
VTSSRPRRQAGLAICICLVLVVGVACGGGSGGRALPSPSASAEVTATAGASPSPSLGFDWPEYHQNAGRSGIGPGLPTFGSPHQAWRAAVDGDVYASPLIVLGHVLVATENNTVYSLDLFSGAVVWHRHLGDPVDASTLACGDIGPVTGITGTPAADVVGRHLYVVAFLRGYHHVLFELSMTDGSVVGQQAVDPPGSDPSVQQERGALALGSGRVYIPFGGLYGDCGNYHGYVVAVPSAGGQTLYYQTPVSREAGIWSPAGPTIDASGNVYVVTGNGSPTQSFAYSNSVIQLSPDLQMRSFFAPGDWQSLDASDTDLGSVGATLLPSLGVVVAVGKQGVAYLLRADALGGVAGQIASGSVCAGAWGGTASSGPMVLVPCSDGLVALSVTQTSFSIAWKAPNPRLGSPIIAAGAVWAIEPETGRLFALDLSSGSVLYTASLGGARHFSTPAATEGFVVAPAGAQVEAFTVAG